MVAAALALPGVAPAAPQAPVFILSFFSLTLNNYKPGTFSGPDYDASLTTQPALTLNSTAHNDIFGFFGQEQQYLEQLFVFAEVTGPLPITVPVDIAYTETDSINGVNGGTIYNYSQFVLCDAFSPSQGCTGTAVAAAPIQLIGSNSQTQTKSGVFHMNVTAGTQFYTGMGVNQTMYAGGAGAPNGVGESASSFMDPMIYIDPAWAVDHPGYSVDVSPGIQNIGGNTAPEPASWALMMVGAALVGGAVRAKSRSRRPSPAA